MTATSFSPRLAPRGQAPLPDQIADWPSYFGRMGRDYDAFAFKGAALKRWADREVEIVLGALGACADPHMVLDIGAGTARFSEPLSRMGWSVSALDGSQEMLDIVAARIPSAACHLGRLGEPLRFEDQSFDAVIAMRVVKYVSDTPAAIAEISRVAKPGGKVVFDVPNGQSLARLGYRRDTIGFVTPASLRRACADAGLRVNAIHGGPRLPHPVLVHAKSQAAGSLVNSVERFATTLLGTETGARALVVEAVRES
jgi:SAM-dependent methyltransferase